MRKKLSMGRTIEMRLADGISGIELLEKEQAETYAVTSPQADQTPEVDSRVSHGEIPPPMERLERLEQLEDPAHDGTTGRILDPDIDPGLASKLILPGPGASPLVMFTSTGQAVWGREARGYAKTVAVLTCVMGGGILACPTRDYSAITFL